MKERKVDHFAAEAETRDIVEIADTGATLVIPILKPSQIDGAEMARADHVQGIFKIGVFIDGPAEVAARSIRQESQHGLRPDGARFIHKTVDDFVEGPVAAHANDAVAAVQKLPAGQMRGVARPRGYAGLKRAQTLSRHRLDPMPFPAGGAVPRRGIYNKSSSF
jgi:hypothetical protein